MIKNYFLFAATLFSTLVTVGQTRTAFVETFTSSTCPPCASGNINLEAVLADPQNDDKYVSLKYQMNWPGNGDPYYTDEGGTRRGVYGVSGVPDTRVDGGANIFTGTFAQSDLDASYIDPAKANITVVYEVNEAAKTISIEGDVEMLVNTNPGMRIYLAVFEYSTQNNVGTNGETSFEHVMKKMLPGDGGVVMPPMSAGDIYHFEQTYQFNGNYTLPASAQSQTNHAIEHSIEEFSDLGVAAWVQTLSTREVYNAQYGVPGTVSVNSNPTNSIASAKIYPNPTLSNAILAIQTVKEQNIAIDIVDGLGQVISSEQLLKVQAGRTTHKMNVSDLRKGLYTVRISSPNGLISRRLVIN